MSESSKLLPSLGNKDEKTLYALNWSPRDREVRLGRLTGLGHPHRMPYLGPVPVVVVRPFGYCGRLIVLNPPALL